MCSNPRLDEGDFDFPALPRMAEASGFAGHYMKALGSLDDVVAARTRFAAMLSDLGID
jgi:hypothetical protein